MIISHKNKEYNPPCENGANIYSQLICKWFIPNIKTDRNWVTINIGKAYDHSIVFIHSNINTVKRYSFLKKYKDLILVCSQKSTCKAIENLGKLSIYLCQWISTILNSSIITFTTVTPATPDVEARTDQAV